MRKRSGLEDWGLKELDIINSLRLGWDILLSGMTRAAAPLAPKMPKPKMINVICCRQAKGPKMLLAAPFLEGGALINSICVVEHTRRRISPHNINFITSLITI